MSWVEIPVETDPSREYLLKTARDVKSEIRKINPKLKEIPIRATIRPDHPASMYSLVFLVPEKYYKEVIESLNHLYKIITKNMFGGDEFE